MTLVTSDRYARSKQAHKHTHTHTHTTPFLNADVCTLQTGPSRDPACSMPHPPSAEEVFKVLNSCDMARSLEATETAVDQK